MGMGVRRQNRIDFSLVRSILRAMKDLLAIFSKELSSWFRRCWLAVLLTGRVFYFLFTRKPDWRVTQEQMVAAGPASLIIAMITAAVIGMIFTIQVAREFQALGAGSMVGGILALALGRELCPIMMAIVVAGRVGSAFAAEIGTMKVCGGNRYHEGDRADRRTLYAQNRSRGISGAAPFNCLLSDGSRFECYGIADRFG